MTRGQHKYGSTTTSVHVAQGDGNGGRRRLLLL